jgi:Ca2+-binding EF-hand superfamily protein
LTNHCIYIADKDLCALIDRYDRARDGKIAYNEFLGELTAKQLS